MDTLTMCPMQDREVSGRLHGYESNSHLGRCNVALECQKAFVTEVVCQCLGAYISHLETLVKG
jgi:hypothetical protein